MKAPLANEWQSRMNREYFLRLPDENLPGWFST